MFGAENLCRLCGIHDANKHSVFKYIGRDTIAFKIKKCLNISIFQGDCKPKEICDQCLVKLEQFSDFMDVCAEVNQRLDSCLLTRNTWSTNLTDPELVQQKSVIVNLKDSVASSNDYIGILPLETIDVNFSEDVLQIVENSNLCSAEKICDSLNTVARCVQYYPETNNTVLRHSSFVENDPIQSNLDHIYQPKKDESNISTNCIYSQNQITCENSYKCQNMEKSFHTKNNNIKTIHTRKSELSENLMSVDSIRQKLKIPNDLITCNKKLTKKYECSHCDKIFIRKLSLNSHLASHTQNRPFICPKCGKAFPIKSELTVHKKIHSEQYQCKICFKSFVVPSKLRRHVRTHTKEKPFKCNFKNCEKMFSDQSNLFEHKETHKEGRNLKCDFCEKYFKTKNQLKSHRMSHKLDISFTCDICKKCYKYKTNLIFHMKKHTGYVCPFCKMNCEKLTTLVKHRKECEKNTKKIN